MTITELLEDIINEFEGHKQIYLSMDRICELWRLSKEQDEFLYNLVQSDIIRQIGKEKNK